MRSEFFAIFVIIISASYVSSDEAVACLKPEEVTETGKGVAQRITSWSWTNMKQYLREQRSKLNLSKTEQDNCKSEFIKGFRDGISVESYSFYYPTVSDWFHKEEDEAFKPYFQYGGYGY